MLLCCYPAKSQSLYFWKLLSKDPKQVRDALVVQVSGWELDLPRPSLRLSRLVQLPQ